MLKVLLLDFFIGYNQLIPTNFLAAMQKKRKKKRRFYLGYPKIIVWHHPPESISNPMGEKKLTRPTKKSFLFLSSPCHRKQTP